MKFSFSILTFIALLASSALAQESSTSTDTNYMLKYVRLYSDAKGISHFKDETLIVRSSPSRATPSVLQLEGAKGATILRLKAGAVEDFHKAPRKQYLFMLRGLVEVTAGDGEKRKFSPGDVVLMEDTEGQGHITKSVGKEDHVVLFVPLVSE
jgi:quercetin dioxygenase-like cupin family protein